MPSILNTDQKFKKPQQIVGRPETTKSDIHEDFMKSPPNNHESTTIPEIDSKTAREQARQERRYLPVAEEGEALGIREPLGREKKEADLAELAQDNSLHP